MQSLIVCPRYPTSGPAEHSDGHGPRVQRRVACLRYFGWKHTSGAYSTSSDGESVLVHTSGAYSTSGNGECVLVHTSGAYSTSGNGECVLVHVSSAYSSSSDGECVLVGFLFLVFGYLTNIQINLKNLS